MAATYAQQLEQAKKAFQTAGLHSAKSFQDTRSLWDDILNRNYPVKLQQELKDIQQGIDYQTTEAKAALSIWKAVLRMNPTAFDIITTKQDEDTKDAARQVLLFLGRGWNLENEGRWWDGAVGEGQVQHGVKVMQYLWDTCRPYPFYWKDRDVYSVYWLGDENRFEGPTAAFCEYELPYIEAQDIYKRPVAESEDYEGPEQFEHLSLRGGSAAWTGIEQQLDETTTGATVRVVVVDCEKPERCPLPGCNHYMRSIKTYVCGPSDKLLTDDHLYQEIDSPWPGNSFFIIPADPTSSRDLNLRYPSPLESLYVESYQVNYLTTLLLTMIRRDYSALGLYANIAGVNEAWMQEDAQQRFVTNLADLKEGEVPWSPPIERIPMPISAHLPQLRQDHQLRLAEARPNRFLGGNAYSEASNATATVFTLALQQAGLQPSVWLANSDKAILRRCRYLEHAVKYWGQADPSAEYGVTMTGAETGVRYEGVEPGKRGERIKVSARSFEAVGEFDLAIRTKSETQAEEKERWFLADNQHDKGAITDEQWLRAAGVDDIQGQEEALEKDRTRHMMNPFVMEMKKQLILREIYGLSGFDFSSLMSLAAQQQPGPHQQQGFGRPGGMPGENAWVAGGGMNNVNPTVRPPAINRPAGGTNPMGAPVGA